MVETRFIDRPRAKRGISYAALYVSNEPLDDLRAVAHRYDSDAEVAEVPGLGVLVVRYLNVPDHHPSHMDYEVVPDGHYLVYSETYHLLYESSAETFTREHEAT